MSPTMKTIQSRRRMEKGAITRAYNFVQNPPQELFAEQIEERIFALEASWKLFTELTGELYNFAEEADFVDPDQEILQYEEKYLYSQAVLKRLRKSFQTHESTPEPQADMFSRLAEQHSTLLQRLDSPSTSRNTNEELPKIRIEPFTGRYKDWPAFKDLFISAIDSKPNLSNIQKFQYLRSLLKDEAANLIKHMQISDLSYNTAWDRLKERFDRPRHIVNSYIETFMGLPSMKEANAANLRNISDVSNEIVRGLEAIQYNERDHWLIYILQNKIDNESRRKWIEKSRDEHKPTINQFLSFLDQCCEELELGKHIVSKSTDSRRRIVSFVSTNQQRSCADCGSDDHHTHKCPHFLSLSIDQRRSLVKRKLLCFNCLRTGHTAYACKSQHKCRSCQRNHHTLVHPIQVDAAQQSHTAALPGSQTRFSENKNVEQVSLNTIVSQSNLESLPRGSIKHILPTALVDVRNCKGHFVSCRLVLDTASELSYITEDCIKRLGLQRHRSRVELSGISSVKAESTHGHTYIHMKSRNSENTMDVQVHILGRITSALPRNTIGHLNHEELGKLCLADPLFWRSRPIDILLGADYVWEAITQEKLLDKKGRTIAVSTVFGWIVTSILSSIQPHTSSSSLITLADINTSLQSFWKIEEVDTHCKPDDEHALVEKHFQETHSRHIDGRYMVELPFREDNVRFGNTYLGALARFNATERRLVRDTTLKESYVSFMREYHNLGHMRELSPSEIDVGADGRLFYLPHHPVIGPKLRVVFDGSFQDNENNSLNDKLHIGPSLQRNLFAVCFRFRLHRVVFSADIIKMFRQIWVAEDHRNFQRILWRENPNAELKHFQLCTVTYGTASAPYLSVRVLEQLARDYEQSHPNASKIILEDFYVDDVLTGASTPEELLEKREELIDLLSQAGFGLSKWVSNCSNITPCSKEEQIFLGKDETDTRKVLGIYWSAAEDSIRYNINIEDSTIATKRRVISDVARVFDPLGLLSPIAIKFKILFQELWLLNLEWDTPLPQNLAKLWRTYRDDLKNLASFRIPRYVPNSTCKLELHGFSDASMKAYSAVVYCKTEDSNGDIVVSLLASKTRVAPLKQVSLPRLELCGALLLTRLLKAITTSLPHRQCQINAWCDSTVVLSWLSIQPTKLKTFVGNRTSEILDTLPRNVWKHVSSKDNPADCASRGLLVNQLMELDLWWTGPPFLRGHRQDASIGDTQFTVDDDYVRAEMKPTTALISVSQCISHPLGAVLKDVSHWYRLIRIAAYVQRFINLVAHKIPVPANYLTYGEVKHGRIICLRMAQGCLVTENTGLRRAGKLNINSGLIKLSPYFDTDGLLRVGGRISNSLLAADTQHPIILPKEHKITRLILNEEHAKNLHPGVSALFVIVRQRYWIIGARNLIRQLTHKCLKCFRNAQHATQQRMADLPRCRVRQAFPFENTGCDYAGPFTLKLHPGRNSKTSKGYICVFVCMVTSAIHLELATNLTTDCFLAALRRFMARRGKCSTIYSDNGKNFVGAKRKLNEMYQHLQAEDHHRIITETLARDNINWVLIPPYSPHWGGMWESGVRSVKLHLRRVVGSTILTFEQMHTLLAQIEAIINSRPLGYAPDTDAHYLSPSHLLLGRSSTMIPEGNLTELRPNRLDYWQHIQCMYQGFWRTWSREYLTSLQQRPKWAKAEPNIGINDVVLVKEDNTPPATWIIGRVTDTFPGKDGLVRAVQLRTSKGAITRSIVRIVKLPTC